MTTAEDVERVARVSGPGLVTLRWTCNRRVGAGRTRTCGTVFTATATRLAHAAGRAQAQCTGCGCILTQTPQRCEVMP